MRNLNELKLTELRETAKDLGVKGWWNMKKTDLIKAIEEAEIVPDEPEIVEDIPVKVEEEIVPEVVQDDEEPIHKKNKKRLIEYKGKTQTLTAWAKELGIRHQTLYNRIVMKGWDVDKAFEAPVKKGVKADVEETKA